MEFLPREGHVDGGGLLLALFVEDFQADVMIENSLQIASADHFVTDVNPPKERFHAGVFVDHRRLHVALGVRNRKPGNIDGA